jgi:hypothetical protein
MDIKIPAPVPGEDYPRNWNEFFDWFATVNGRSELTHFRSYKIDPGGLWYGWEGMELVDGCLG